METHHSTKSGQQRGTTEIKFRSLKIFILHEHVNVSKFGEEVIHCMPFELLPTTFLELVCISAKDDQRDLKKD